MCEDDKFYCILKNKKIGCYFIVIKIYKKKVSVQEQYLLLLEILPKFWSRFQFIYCKTKKLAVI